MLWYYYCFHSVMVAVRHGYGIHNNVFRVYAFNLLQSTCHIGFNNLTSVFYASSCQIAVCDHWQSSDRFEFWKHKMLYVISHWWIICAVRLVFLLSQLTNWRQFFMRLSCNWSWFRLNIVKVAVDPRGDNRVDPQTTIASWIPTATLTIFTINNRTDAWKTDVHSLRFG